MTCTTKGHHTGYCNCMPDYTGIKEKQDRLRCKRSSGVDATRGPAGGRGGGGGRGSLGEA